VILSRIRIEPVLDGYAPYACRFLEESGHILHLAYVIVTGNCHKILVWPHAHTRAMLNVLGVALSITVQAVERHAPGSSVKIMFNASVLTIYDHCIEVWCVQSDASLIKIRSKIYRVLLCYAWPSLFKNNHEHPSQLYFLLVTILIWIIFYWNKICLVFAKDWTGRSWRMHSITWTLLYQDLIHCSNFLTTPEITERLIRLKFFATNFKTTKFVHYRIVTVWISLPEKRELSINESVIKFK